MKRYLTISDLAERTGRSERYWQNEAKSGRVPGCYRRCFGKRSVYEIEEAGFDEWWESKLEPVEPCQLSDETFANVLVAPHCQGRSSQFLCVQR
ncbi:MAG: hypothetical protein ACR2PS_08610 [Pseudomonadales bacterium]